MLVLPFNAFGQNAGVSGRLLKVGNLLELSIDALEVALVVRGTVTNHDLGGVLVGHHDSRLRELGANCVWVVWHKRLLGHPNVEVGLLSVGLSCKQKDKNK